MCVSAAVIELQHYEKSFPCAKTNESGYIMRRDEEKFRRMYVHVIYAPSRAPSSRQKIGEKYSRIR